MLAEIDPGILGGIFIGACVAIAIPGFGLLYYRAQEVKKRGIPLRAWIVQANDELYEPGKIDMPALLLISFPGPRGAPDELLASLAARIFELRTKPAKTQAERKVAALAIDETFHSGFKKLLPHEFTGGRDVYCIHQRIQRSCLPGGVLKGPYVWVKAVQGIPLLGIHWIMIPFLKDG